MSKNKYFLFINARHLGPFNDIEVQSLVDSGEVTELTKCWFEGASDWEPLEKIRPEFFHPVALAQVEDELPPPLPPLPIENDDQLQDQDHEDQDEDELPPPLPPLPKEEDLSEERTGDEVFGERETEIEPDPEIQRDRSRKNISKRIKFKTIPWSSILFVVCLVLIGGTGISFYFSLPDQIDYSQILNEKHRDRWRQFVEEKPPENIFVAPTKSLDGLFVDTNLKGNFEIDLTLNSTRGENKEMKERSLFYLGEIKNGKGVIDTFHFKKGSSMLGAIYTYELRGERVDPLGKLLKKLAEIGIPIEKITGEQKFAFLYKGKVVFSKASKDELAKQIQAVQDQALDKLRGPLQERLQSYRTLLSLLDKVENLYLTHLAKNYTRFQVRKFERDYAKEVGPLFQAIVIQNQETFNRLANLDPTESKKFDLLLKLAKKVGGLSSDIVEQSKKLKKRSDHQRLKRILIRRFADLKAELEKAENSVEDQIDNIRL